MANCIENNNSKTDLTTSLLLRVEGENSFTSILENIIKKLVITEESDFLTYIKEGSKGRRDIDAIINRIINLANDWEINAYTVTRELSTSANSLLQDLEVEPTILINGLDTEVEVNEIPTVNITEVDVTTEEAVIGTLIDDSIPAEANIVHMEGVQTLDKVYEHYLLDDLSRNPTELKNTFKKLVSRNWLSTKSDVKIIDNFDNEQIKDNIKKDAKDTITSYYRKSAEAVSSLGGANNIFFFSDINRLPNGAEIIPGNNAAGSFLCWPRQSQSRLFHQQKI